MGGLYQFYTCITFVNKGRFTYLRKVFTGCLTCCLYKHLRLCRFFCKQVYRGRRGRDRMVVGFTTTYAISAYHH